MKKIFSKKLMYIIAILSVLAMMIPMSIPAIAAGGTITMKLVDPVTFIAADNDSGYNITGSTVEITVTGDTVAYWSKLDYVIGTNSAWVPNVDPGAVQTVRVTGVWGETVITATMTDNSTLSVDKKWGQIETTVITPPGSSPVTWNEGAKAFSGEASITDVVWGDFKTKDGSVSNVMQGAILHWYLVDGNLAIPTAGSGPHPYESAALQAAMLALSGSDFVYFVDGSGVMIGTGTEQTTVSGADGTSTVNLFAWGEENVKIVVVPEYPNNPQIDVVPEVTSWNFWTREMETVPQVRWVGEKIVLEKNFTTMLSGRLVNFVITSGEGALEQFGPTPNGIGLNLTSNGQSVWTEVDPTGMASVILTADAANQVNVRAALYDSEGTYMDNQHAFTVYFLKFESLVLSDVPGKRVDHNDGIWELPSNPFNQYFPAAAYGDLQNPQEFDDVLVQDGNVSQDLLERAQVKGWFMGVNGNFLRPEDEGLDADGDGTPEVLLPKYRWVLPDDWAQLAGMNNWTERRIHWDIMDNPADTIDATTPTGQYLTGQYTPVRGPFSPGIELMTPTGWDLSNTSPDPLRQMKTVVPDGFLDAWDAPMPPAKIIFEITDGNGYFKDTNKADIYILDDEYTTPFYEAMIPAHWAIPAFINNGGYDWASFDATEYGPYEFWTIINRPGMNAMVASADWSGHPTKVEVYSDNHGEAMVYLNGDWNLELLANGFIGGKDGASIAFGSEVGTTTVQAMADYPYVRTEVAITSNEVEKTWFWGGQILGIDNATYNNGGVSDSSLMVLAAGQYTWTGGDLPADDAETGVGYSDDYVAFVWATDRDNRQEGVLGTRIEWRVSGGAFIPVFVPHARISTYNLITKDIYLDASGFLEGTMGVVTNPDRTIGYSFMRAPTLSEQSLFLKKWPTLDPNDYAVAAVDVYSVADIDSTISIFMSGTDFGYPGHPIGMVDHSINIMFGQSYPLDDPIVPGDANIDGVVNAADIAAVENIIVGAAHANVNADTSSNGTIDMGDVVKITRIIHGLQ